MFRSGKSKKRRELLSCQSWRGRRAIGQFAGRHFEADIRETWNVQPDPFGSGRTNQKTRMEQAGSDRFFCSDIRVRLTGRCNKTIAGRKLIALVDVANNAIFTLWSFWVAFFLLSSNSAFYWLHNAARFRTVCQIPSKNCRCSFARNKRWTLFCFRSMPCESFLFYKSGLFFISHFVQCSSYTNILSASSQRRNLPTAFIVTYWIPIASRKYHTIRLILSEIAEITFAALHNTLWRPCTVLLLLVIVFSCRMRNLAFIHCCLCVQLPLLPANSRLALIANRSPVIRHVSPSRIGEPQPLCICWYGASNAPSIFMQSGRFLRGFTFVRCLSFLPHQLFSVAAFMLYFLRHCFFSIPPL